MLSSTILLFTLATVADGVERMKVPDPRPLLIAAIDAPVGAAYGVLVGPVGTAFGERFATSSPLLVDVSTEWRYAQAGCSRLKLAFHQAGVVLPGAAISQDRRVEIGINYCRDGRPPKSLRKEGP